MICKEFPHRLIRFSQARTEDAVKTVKPFGQVELNHPVSFSFFFEY